MEATYGSYSAARATAGRNDGEWFADCPLCGAVNQLHIVGCAEEEAALTCRASGCEPEALRELLFAERIPEAPAGIEIPAERSSWEPVDLGPALAGDRTEPAPSLLPRGDGSYLLYPAKIHQWSGEPEACKGWGALFATSEALQDGQRVVYVDLEDDEATTVARLQALGVTKDEIREHFTYVRPHEPLIGAGEVEIRGLLDPPPALVVIDGVTEALTIHGLDLGDNADIARWLELLPRPLQRSGAAVLLIDHVVKDKEARGRYALGAQHKLAGIDVAYSLEVIEPFGRGRDGLVKVTVHKDRPGYVRQYADEGRVADMHLHSDAQTGAVSIEFQPPGDQSAFRPTFLMGRVWQAIEADPGITTRGVREAVRGKTDAKALALNLLVSDGFVHVREEGQARHHYTAKPYLEEASDPNRDPVTQPVPNRDPARSSTTVTRAPSPVGGTVRGTQAEGTPKTTAPCPSPLLSEDELADRLISDFDATEVAA